jgi:hypothetical protein
MSQFITVETTTDMIGLSRAQIEFLIKNAFKIQFSSISPQIPARYNGPAEELTDYLAINPVPEPVPEPPPSPETPEPDIWEAVRKNERTIDRQRKQIEWLMDRVEQPTLTGAIRKFIKEVKLVLNNEEY